MTASITNNTNHDDDAKLIISVDDFMLTHRYINQALTPEGYRLENFLSAKECIKNLRTLSPKLIISDIEMPNMNGLDFIETLKSFEQTENIPIIFLSALFNQKTKQQAEALGAAAYITKPFRASELVSIVNTILH